MKNEKELLQEISDKLSDMISLLKLGQKTAIELSKDRLLASKLRSNVYNLCDGKHSVSEITAELNKSQPLISHYLKDLEDGGLIKADRKGKNIFYIKLA